MKKLKVYIVTYKRNEALNETLERLFNSDFSSLSNTEVTVINNHSDLELAPGFENRVRVLNNETRPDWSNGNLGENWNHALLDGFRDLKKPDSEYVVTFQNDTVVSLDWCKNLFEMHEKYNFIVGQYGDNLVSYTPEAVSRIGIWDENFTGIQYKEADYWLRALIFNKDKSCINDTLHGLVLNNKDALPLDVAEGRNFQEEKNLTEKILGKQGVLKRRADDEEHAEIWETRGGLFKLMAWKYFCHKWSGTWLREPTKEGWIKNWSSEMINNPPDFSKSKVVNYMRYVYFEKDILDLEGKNYLV